MTSNATYIGVQRVCGVNPEHGVLYLKVRPCWFTALTINMTNRISTKEKSYEVSAYAPNAMSSMDKLLLGEDFRLQVLFSLYNNIKYVNDYDMAIDSRTQE